MRGGKRKWHHHHKPKKRENFALSNLPPSKRKEKEVAEKLRAKKGPPRVQIKGMLNMSPPPLERIPSGGINHLFSREKEKGLRQRLFSPVFFRVRLTKIGLFVSRQKKKPTPPPTSFFFFRGFARRVSLSPSVPLPPPPPPPSKEEAGVKKLKLKVTPPCSKSRSRKYVIAA